MQTSPGVRKALPHTYELRESCATMTRAVVDRRALRQAASDAAEALALPGASHGVLLCLASCYGEQALPEGLMVWPSNDYLSRKTGYSERAIRYAILHLRSEGLILANDSPNHKRRTQGQGNRIERVYGFDLSPLLLHAPRFATILAERHAGAALRRNLTHQINAARKNITAIRAAVIDDHPAFAAILDDHLVATKPPRSKSTTLTDLESLLVRAEAAYADAEYAFYALSKTQDSAATGGKDCRHIEPKTESSIENCQDNRSDATASQHPPKDAAFGGEWAFREKKGGTVRQTERAASAPPIPIEDPAVWRAACPHLHDTGLPVSTLDEIAYAGLALAPDLQLRPSERAQALTQLEPLLFGLLCAYVAQIVEDSRATRHPITRPGGLFVSIKRAVLTGERDLALDIMALRRKHGQRAAARNPAGVSIDAPATPGAAIFRAPLSSPGYSNTRDRR